MRKRKYEYTEKQEKLILEIAESIIAWIMIVLLMLIAIIIVILTIIYPIPWFSLYVILVLSLIVYRFYLALVVLNHRKKVKSQDDNIEQG